MPSSSRLLRILAPVLKTLRVDPAQLNATDRYVFEIKEGLSFQFEETPEQFLTLSCLFPMQEVHFSSPEILNTLLQCNLLGLEHSPILTATLQEKMRALIWTLLPFSQLELYQMAALFERFSKQADALQRYLQRPLSAEMDR